MWISANEITDALECRDGAGTAESNNGGSLDAVFETHVCNEATAHVGADIASAGANGEKIDVFRGQAARVQAVRNRPTADMNRTTQVALIELIGAFVPIEVAFKIEMAKVDVAVQKDLPYAIALISRGTKAFLLRKPERRVCRSNSDDGWMDQVVLTQLKRGLRPVRLLTV